MNNENNVQSAIRIENVSKSYADNGVDSTKVLNHINLDIASGEFICVLGKSGCGKSTLLNMLAGYIKADEGAIYTYGKKITGPSQERGVIFQEHALFPWFTVKQNVAFGPAANKKKDANEIAMKYIEMIGLEKFANYYPEQLSGGMKQRVGIARAFANQPRILLMDEPFSALDPDTRSNMQKQVVDIWEKNKTTIVFITHSVEEAVYLADRIIILNREVVCNEKVNLRRARDKYSDEFREESLKFENILTNLI